MITKYVKKLVPVIAVLVILMACYFYFQSYWQLEYVNTDGPLTVKISESNDNDLVATVVFLSQNSNNLHGNIFKLPHDAEDLPDTSLEFADTTIGPGRVIIIMHGHKIDIMTRNIIIDDVEYDWNLSEPIRVK